MVLDIQAGTKTLSGMKLSDEQFNKEIEYAKKQMKKTLSEKRNAIKEKVLKEVKSKRYSDYLNIDEAVKRGINLTLVEIEKQDKKFIQEAQEELKEEFCLEYHHPEGMFCSCLNCRKVDKIFQNKFGDLAK